ncbi:MAG: class I SAM-dependent methyltransferase [Thermoleophilia bacterium]|nr:class I SAM-dependent methyltransferase [Thermoleophilia bacterium]
MTSRPAWGRVATTYARSRPGYPPAALALLARLGAGLPGQAVVDVGCGTGALTRGLADAGATVTGVDPDDGMLAAAIALGGGAAYRRGSAEATGLSAGCADAVTAAQCWHWTDRPRAAAEALRLLRTDGVLAILSMDWVEVHPVVRATAAAVLRHRPAAAWSPATPGASWAGELVAAGFRDVSRDGAEVVIEHPVRAWVDRILVSAPVGPSVDRATSEAVCASVLRAVTPLAREGLLRVPHRVEVLAARA